MNNPDYIGALRPRLPPEALRPYPRACIAICIHFAIVIGCVIASLYTASGRWFVLGLVAGNSRAALSFLAHDVSHRSVVTSRYLIYPLRFSFHREMCQGLSQRGCGTRPPRKQGSVLKFCCCCNSDRPLVFAALHMSAAGHFSHIRSVSGMSGAGGS